ncbi:MAG: hypothetical protein AB8H12_08930 [Lewinella sp.]
MLKEFKSFAGNALAVTILTTAAQVHKHNDKHTVRLKTKLEEEGFRSEGGWKGP